MLVLGVVLWTVAAISCTGSLWFRGVASSPRDDHLAIVRVARGDTLESLAQTHLGDSGKAWVIATANNLQSIRAGQHLVIPLKPIVYGGLAVDGYQAVPVLFYPGMTDQPAARAAFSAALFNDHMRYLRKNGYCTIRLDSFGRFLALADALPAKALLITFDSTERWVFEIAYPILKRHGFTAAVFIATDRIGKPGHLSWPDLAAMAADGFDIGAAGIDGRSLIAGAGGGNAALYLRQLEAQIRQSQETIAQRLDTPCRYFAYPGGETNDVAVAMLQRNGYHGAFTQQPGSNPFFADPFRLKRFVISSQLSLEQFERHLQTFVKADLQ
jgi:peptidoglycan/xylan/chitin deacetylase (PgdA/CDA1 family)